MRKLLKKMLLVIQAIIITASAAMAGGTGMHNAEYMAGSQADTQQPCSNEPGAQGTGWGAIMLAALAAAAPLALVTAKLARENKRLKELDENNKKEKIKQDERLRLLSLVARKNTNSVMILKGDGNFQWQNDSFTNIYGYTASEYQKAFGSNYFEIQKTENPGKAQIMENAKAGKESASYEDIHIGPSGNAVYVQAHLDPVLENNEEIKNWIVTETDITRLKLAEKEGMEQAGKLLEAYADLKKNQSHMEFQTRQLKIINERLEIGYKQIKRQNRTINESLRYACGIQNSMLPSSEKFEEFSDHFVIYWPKDIVSGDFYMTAKLAQDSFITIVADCTGHGVPGAFMSIIGYDILQQIIHLRKITEPKDIVEQLSKQLMEMLSHKRIQNTDSIALSVCKFTATPEKIKMSVSGSNSSVYIQQAVSGKIKRIKTSRRSTGINESSSETFGQQEELIDYQDRIFQLTDGAIDQCNPQRKRYGTTSLLEIISKNPQENPQETGKAIEHSLKAFMLDAGQRDDITVLGFRIKKQWNYYHQQET